MRAMLLLSSLQKTNGMLLGAPRKMEHINYHFRQDTQHRFVYDFETLKYALGRAGFSQIERRGFDPLLDSQDRERGTLYVIAVKPAAPAARDQ